MLLRGLAMMPLLLFQLPLLSPSVSLLLLCLVLVSSFNSKVSQLPAKVLVLLSDQGQLCSAVDTFFQATCARRACDV